MKTIIAIIFCFIFSFYLQNNHDQAVHYNLLWLDHQIKEIHGPARMAGGEVDGLSTRRIREKNQPGAYILEWQLKGKKVWKIQPVEVEPGVTGDFYIQVNPIEIGIEVEE
ncbi:MAG: hypothetical protein JRF72_19060 [Deltaproteobacteria bacterium]|jgi:hypothetical protein|nr:hypothetical protein [Deltaproteobacteria bacterium]